MNRKMEQTIYCSDVPESYQTDYGLDGSGECLLTRTRSEVNFASFYLLLEKLNITVFNIARLSMNELVHRKS